MLSEHCVTNLPEVCCTMKLMSQVLFVGTKSRTWHENMTQNILALMLGYISEKYTHFHMLPNKSCASEQ